MQNLEIVKTIIFSVIAFFSLLTFSNAQCPYVIGVLADADASGTPAGEGKNEFLAFNTGGASVAVNTLYFSYSVSTTTTNYAIDGTTASPSVWTSLVTPSLITNSGGTITVVTSGSIPANKNVVVIPSTNTISYDLKTFGSDVYVLPYNATAGSPRVVGYAAGGNFANSGGTPRYIRIRQGASCRDTVSYIPSSLPGADGGGAKWTASKVITYINSGSSGVVLPINLINFEAKNTFGNALIQWSTAANSTADYFEIEKSLDGITYNKIASIAATKEAPSNTKEYSYTDSIRVPTEVYYRLKIIELGGDKSFSPTRKIATDNSQTKTLIYPNPTSKELSILNQTNIKSAVLTDYTGKAVYQMNISLGINVVDLSQLPNGLYMLQLISDTEIEHHKIVKE